MTPSISELPVPLTEEALLSLNRNTDENSKSLSSRMSSDVSESGTSEAESGSINAYDPEYWNSLEDRDIFFAESKDAPPDFHELREAMLLPRDSPEPDNLKAKNF